MPFIYIYGQLQFSKIPHRALLRFLFLHSRGKKSSFSELVFTVFHFSLCYHWIINNPGLRSEIEIPSWFETLKSWRGSDIIPRAAALSVVYICSTSPLFCIGILKAVRKGGRSRQYNWKKNIPEIVNDQVSVSAQVLPLGYFLAYFACYHTDASLLFQCVIEGKLLLGSGGTTLGQL